MNAEPQELIDALYGAPENQENWAVYGDWLQAHDDPCGELVAIALALQDRGHQPELIRYMKEIFEKQEEYLLGPLLRAAEEARTGVYIKFNNYPIQTNYTKDKKRDLDLIWVNGFIQEASFVSVHRDPIHEPLATLLQMPIGRFLIRLSIRDTNYSRDGGFNWSKALERVPKHPGLRRLSIHHDSIGDLSGIYTRFPDLAELDLEGHEIKFGELKHEKLKELRINTRELSREAIRQLAKAELPGLESLWIHQNSPQPVANFSVFEPFIDVNRLRSLKKLHIDGIDFLKPG